MLGRFRLQHSKLAQKLLAVFLVCVLVPVVGLSTVSYLQVRAQLIEQSETRLARDSQAVAMSIMERLLLAEGMMLSLSPESASERLERRSDDDVGPIDRALWIDGSGQVLQAVGSWPELPTLGPTDAVHLTRGTLLRVDDTSGAVLLGSAGPDGHIWASVDTTFLWGSVSDFATLRGEGTFCVLDATLRPLHCAADMAVSDLAAARGSRDLFAVMIDGQAFRGVNREVYFNWHFGADPWSVVLAEPQSEAVAPLIGFRRAWVPVALLSILVVLFFSSLQLRSILARLLRLQQATAKIAEGEFDMRIEMEGDDEIADLAESFEEMSRRLGGQFALIRATSAVDRAALETETVADLNERVADAVGELFPAAERLVFLGLMRPADRCLVGALTVQRPPSGSSPAVSKSVHVTLTPTNSRRVAALDSSELKTSSELVELVDVAEMRALPIPGPFAVFPVRLDGEVHGFVAVGTAELEQGMRTSSHQLTEQVAVALSNVKRLDQLDRLTWGAMTALARTVDAASQWTAGHSERVAQLSADLGRELGLPDVEIERLTRGGLLHDIGKIGVASRIVEKPGSLDDDEYAQMQQHTVMGAKILEPIESFSDILPLVLHHHERMDGKGYPTGLAGNAIPYGARIMAIADTYDALTSDRPYRKGMEVERALGIIEEVQGTQLDAEMVGTFLTMMRSGPQQPPEEPEPDPAIVKTRTKESVA